MEDIAQVAIGIRNMTESPSWKSKNSLL